MIGGIPFTLSLSKDSRASVVKFPSSILYESLTDFVDWIGWTWSMVVTMANEKTGRPELVSPAIKSRGGCYDEQKRL